MYSDRGTTFVCADALMKDELQLLRNQLEAGSVYASTIGVNWHFIPPAAPYFGGLWEAGVKSVKFHLKRVINTATLTFEEFYTLLKQVESWLNSRSLTALSDDPGDLSVLAPGHFLIGRAPNTIPESNILNTKIGILFRWRLLS
ncbi:uncharacterized protein LOC119667431 [Teleopsis dalmanni]|uniref:uncharacterized protein LOC119667302 n=1 Tax=Teleopsis dalmanni TaxID=139649 RepID=UPI0018CFA687|nr:uncharacterized protein LOC119667302 [Teleopsis dalmanni]XP_037932648.1 uncharacterized protein LOC119667431 [Teleopsis dalmanni]